MKINTVRTRTFRDGRFIDNGFNVYFESNATNVIHKFFHENEIFALRFKSKTWSKMCRMAQKINIASMRTLIGDAAEIKFSVHTGCSMCPCSPVYRVRKAFDKNLKDYWNADVFAKTTVDASEIVKMLPKFKEMLKVEIANHAKENF